MLMMIKIIFISFLDDVDGYIEESDGIKYLVFASTDKNKQAFKKLQRTLGRN